MKIKDNVLIVTSIAEDVSGIEAIKSEFEKIIKITTWSSSTSGSTARKNRNPQKEKPRKTYSVHTYFLPQGKDGGTRLHGEIQK